MPSHYLNQCWIIVYLIPWNIFQWYLNQNSTIYTEENWFENVVCKMGAILSQPQCLQSHTIYRDSDNHQWALIIYSVYAKNQGPISIERCDLTSIWIPHYKNKTVSCLSYLYNGNPHTLKEHLYIEAGPSTQSVNASPSSATYMHQWTGSALVQVMACCLFGNKPLP